MQVLDASAVLALLWSEPGADVVLSHLADAHMSAVNMTEVLSRMIDRGFSLEVSLSLVEGIGCLVHDHALDLAIATAALRPVTRRLGLSLGDRACLALAQSLGAGVVTADRAWAGSDLGVAITVIR